LGGHRQLKQVGAIEVHHACPKLLKVRNSRRPETGTKLAKSIKLTMPRLLLDWSGKALTIERAAEGGVKPKSIGEAAVVLQSWKLGNLNFDKPKVTGADASLHLTARPSRS
jgi:hypothetical protein